MASRKSILAGLYSLFIHGWRDSTGKANAIAIQRMFTSLPDRAILTFTDSTGFSSEPLYIFGKDAKGWMPADRFRLSKISFIFNQLTADATNYIFSVYKWTGTASVKIGEILDIDNGATGFHNHELVTANFSDPVIDPSLGERFFIFISNASAPYPQVTDGTSQVTGNQDHAVIIEIEHF